MLAVALAIAVVLLFDPKDYQPLLEKSVEQSTGRKLTLAGDLGLQTLPLLQRHARPRLARQPAGVPRRRIRERERRRAEPEGLAADHEARGRDRQGASRWPERESDGARRRRRQLAVRERVPGGARPRRGKEHPAASSTASPASRSARVGSRTATSRRSRATSPTTSRSRPATSRRAGHSTSSSSAKLTDETDGTSGTVALKSRATLDTGESRLTLEKPAIELAAAGKSLPAKSVGLKLGAAGLVIESKQDTKFQFRKLEGEFELPGLKAIAGDVKGSFTAGDASLATGASTEAILPQLTADFTVSGKDIPGDTISAKLKAGGIALDVDKMRGAIDSLSADINGLGAKLALTGGGRIADTGADLAGSLTLDPVSPRSLLAILKKPEPKTADPQALTRMSGKAGVGARQGLAAPARSSTSSSTRRSSRAASASRTSQNRPRASIWRSMRSTSTAICAPECAGRGAGRRQRTTASQGDDIPVETIRNLRLDGRAQIGQLTFAKAKMTDVSATLHAADGTLRLDPLSAQLYGGEYRGAVAIDATGPRRALSDRPADRGAAGGRRAQGSLPERQAHRRAQRPDQCDRHRQSQRRHREESRGQRRAESRRRRLPGHRRLARDPQRAREDQGRRAAAGAREPADEDRGHGACRQHHGRRAPHRQAARRDPVHPHDRHGRARVSSSKTMDYRLQAQVFETPTFEDGTTLKDLDRPRASRSRSRARWTSRRSAWTCKELATGVATQKLTEQLLKKLGLRSQPPPAPPRARRAGEPQPAAGRRRKRSPRDALKRPLRDLLKPKP